MKRQVYGSHYTYPGGVAFAVMVARACQLMPSSYPNVVLRFFFAFYTQWLSRHDRILPVYITASLENQGRIQGLPESWDPQRESCREDLFPVINPAYPYVNDAHNIGRCGLEAFYTEITRAHQVLSDSDSPLEKIWELYHITDWYDQYLLVQVCSWADNEEDAKRFHTAWSSYVASKLRFFIYDMEQLVDIRPYPHKIDNTAIKQTGQYRAFVGECFFVLAVKERNNETKLDLSMFFEAFKRFKHFIADGCVNTEDGVRFVFNGEAMRGPYFRLVDAAHLPFAMEK
ncbi:putative poly(A) polymerase, putative,polynucleotide adenylyltransferase [Trypanosoma theileri]|uniref:polynucleotide adenylyltransferase n=1 Tax=Trypanosoma theileri TaxID=67003 RepID=A0A1X0P931_9TRYP|nr:putative poly(A) polymerase, putative,polynucleotide adenylyltransferase [Trypanosoma theileri]ORC93426.1 putative poly(A) polymerase, putative,polynucleotide adenylyltransferase [Trypanosoma theileri]